MKYFKNTNNEIFAYDDEQIKQGYGKDLTPITEGEKNNLLKPTQEQILQQQIAEAKSYLTETGWIWEKYNRNVLVLKDMTSDEFNLKYSDIISKQEEARALINELEVQLGGN